MLIYFCLALDTLIRKQVYIRPDQAEWLKKNHGFVEHGDATVEYM
jgi:hypothetical protein